MIYVLSLSSRFLVAPTMAHKRLLARSHQKQALGGPAPGTVLDEEDFEDSSSDSEGEQEQGAFRQSSASSASASASASSVSAVRRSSASKGRDPSSKNANGDRGSQRRIRYTNKQRCLVLCSRGAVAQYRHLMGDIRRMLPHHKKEVKLDTKRDLKLLNEIATMKSCNTCLFFEFRKRQDLYLWMSNTPNGPSVKFLVQNVHTMDELKLTGNCLMGSRPILSFDRVFDERPQLRLLKEMLSQVFGTPEGHPKSKPFIDHVFNFSYLDGNIWFRNYQIVENSLDERAVKKAVRKGATDHNKLIEIGPRFVLNPIRIFSGSFGGQTLYANPRYESPNVGRAREKKFKGGRYTERLQARAEARQRDVDNTLPVNPMAKNNAFRK